MFQFLESDVADLKITARDTEEYCGSVYKSRRVSDNIWLQLQYQLTQSNTVICTITFNCTITQREMTNLAIATQHDNNNKNKYAHYYINIYIYIYIYIGLLHKLIRLLQYLQQLQQQISLLQQYLHRSTTDKTLQYTQLLQWHVRILEQQIGP